MLISLSDFDTLFWRTAEGGSALQSDRSSTPLNAYQEWREYLNTMNQGNQEEEWLIRCIRLAPNAPEQNPIEDVWLQGKEMVRRYWNLCSNFKIVKWLFSWTINQGFFKFPKLSMYGSFA